MKRIVLLFVLIALVAGLSYSQTGTGALDTKTKDALKELLKELRDWAQSDIIPKMKEWKGTLDHAMSPEDLQALNTLRDEAAQMKNMGKRLAAAVIKGLRNNNLGDVRKYRQKLTELKKKRDELLKNLKPLGVKYSSTLVQIGREAKLYAKDWKESGKKIVATWYGTHQNDFGPGFRTVLAKATERVKQFAGMDDGLKAKIAAARFMLWHGQDLPDFSQMLNDETPGSESMIDETTEGYVLESNYPNPFNPSTTISFSIPQAGHVSLVVYDALGREVATLVDAELGAGGHSVVFDGKNLSSGTYIYRIRASDFVQEKKMQLVK